AELPAVRPGPSARAPLLRGPDPERDRVRPRSFPGAAVHRRDVVTMLHRVQQTVRYLGATGADDRHATETARILRQLGADEEVVVAGILHDAAKPANTLLWHRIAGVLLEMFAPHVRSRLAKGDSTFARYLDHARRGAELARRDGASERVV